MAFKSATYKSINADFDYSDQVFNADLKEFDKQKIASSKDFDANTGEAKVSWF